MKKNILCIIISILIGNAYAQQDPNFSQYIFNTIYINPAYAGYKDNIYLQSHYRMQWTGVEGAPRSLSIAADGGFKENKIGLSLLINSDRIGVQDNLSAYAGYAYHLHPGQDETSKLSFGISAGFVQSLLYGDRFIPDMTGDNSIPAGNHNRILPDARFGIIYTRDKFFSGISASNILSGINSSKRTNEWYIGMKPHFYLFGGFVSDLSDDIKIKPLVLLKDDLGGPSNLDLNIFLLLRERIWIGAMYRTAVPLYDKKHLQKDLNKNSATGLMLEVFPTQRMRIGYSFDYSVNQLRTYNNGTHEISIGLYLRESKYGDRYSHCYF